MGECSSGQEAVGRFPVISKLSPFSTKLDERRELCFAMKYDYGVQRLYEKTQREVNPPTYRSALLLSRGLRCMVNNIQWRRVKHSLLQPALLHAWCHFAQLI